MEVIARWSKNTDTMGVYGNYYFKRAIVAQIGLGANFPEDAIYPINLADEAGNKYLLHFDKGSTPPANAFWSVTLYDAEGFQVANPLNDRAERCDCGVDVHRRSDCARHPSQRLIAKGA